MAPMLRHVSAELARRRGRALLTVLGLAVGVALVVAVTALQRGVDTAQEEVFAPLAGVGTDVLVSRPVDLGEGGGDAGLAALATLPAEEQRALRRENEDAFLDPSSLGEPGEPFETDSFLPATQLTFPEELAEGLERLDGAAIVGRALTVLLVRAEGEVPEQTAGPRPTFQGGDIVFSTSTVAGIEAGQPEIGLITPAELTRGRFIETEASRPEAVVADGYAARRGIDVGDRIELDGRRIEVVGTASPPVGGQAADIYLDLPFLQELADRDGRVNVLLVRASSAGRVEALSGDIEEALPGLVASSSRELARTVEGSLVGAGELSDRLGLLLAVVALAAAVLIASLLMLSGVQKRTRELGTLRALGWSRARVVWLVIGEALALGLVGAAAGAALGAGAAALGAALVPGLEASAPSAIGLGSILSSEGSATPTVEVAVSAPVDLGLIGLAVGLAIGAALLAGAAGAARAARLEPAEALRRVD